MALRILNPLCQPAPGTAAATRPCSQITLGRLVDNVYQCLIAYADDIAPTPRATRLVTRKKRCVDDEEENENEK